MEIYFLPVYKFPKLLLISKFNENLSQMSNSISVLIIVNLSWLKSLRDIILYRISYQIFTVIDVISSEETKRLFTTQEWTRIRESESGLPLYTLMAQYVGDHGSPRLRIFKAMFFILLSMFCHLYHLSMFCIYFSFVR